MQSQVSTFIITREDLAVDPVTLVTDGLQIGRSPDCGLVLNHPTVSRLHAGIKETGGRFYIFNFSHSSGTTLNGRVLQVEEPEVLADSDVVQIGPFFLALNRTEDALEISVSLQVTVLIGEAEGRGEQQNPEQHAVPPKAASSEVASALNVFWAARKREAGKMQRLSPMRPQTPSRVLGKARFNWTPTRDLVRPWPTAVFTWGVIIVGILSIAAALGYTSAFSPAPVSDPHVRNTLQTTPAIARQPNANSCTTCHTLTGSMESNCASCHQAEAFHATVIKPHADAGVGCIDCHAEHRGADFRASAFAHQTCTSCHNDANTRVFNGKRVGTPHGGTFGYPIENGKWTWMGLSQEEWSRKPEEMRTTLARWPANEQDKERLSAQFHVLHLHRVRAPEGMPRNKDGEMSCSSCHRSAFNPIDRETPRTTCAKCHNGNIDGLPNQTSIAADAPNCNSCHVQHTQARRTWGTSLLVRDAGAAPDKQQAVSQIAPLSSNTN